MESSLSEDVVNKITRATLMKYIKNREIEELTKNLKAIKPEHRSQILLDTGTSGITHLSYAIRYNLPKNTIKKIIEIAEEDGILKQLLKIKNRHGNTALDFARKYDNSHRSQGIVELLLNKEQELGLVSHCDYNGKNITMTDSRGISMGEQIKIVSEASQQEQVLNEKKLTEVCSGSTPSPSMTIDGSTVTISDSSNIHSDGKGVTVSGKKIL